MKKHLFVSAALVCTLGAQVPAVQAAELETLEQKASYLMGLRLGLSLEDFGYELDVDALKQGIKESNAEERTLSEDELREAVALLQERAKENQMRQVAEISAANQKASEAFLTGNANKKGVKVTDSGLQYKILTEGDGSKPSESDVVKVHYKGTLVDGTEFDSSFKHGRPATFPLNGVIPGWTEGLQLLSKGAKAELYIPAALAYGERGMPPVIGPNSALIFEVELLDINPETEETETTQPAE